MSRARRLAALLALVATAAAPLAQTALQPEPITRAAPVIVEEPRLVADAAGTTRLRLDDTAPPATQSLSSLSGRIANFHVNAGGAGSFGDLFALRGLTNTPYFSDPSVTLYFDDLPLGSSFSYPTGLFGFATATIHRGPQATAFGRAGEGGVVVFASAPPAAESSGELRGSLGNFNARSAAFTSRSASLPGGQTDATVAASFSERDGYIANTQLHTRVDDARSSAISARFRFRPTPASELTLQLLGSRLRNGAQPLVPLGGPLFTVARGREGEAGSDFAGAALKAAFATPLGQLSATTSVTDWTLDPYNNRLVLPPTLDSRLTQTQRAWNEEFRLAADPHAALAWNAGAWFSDSRTAGDVHRAIPNLFPLEASTYALHARTAALFGQLTFLTAGDWHLTAGLRAERVKKDFDRRQTVPGPDRFTADKSFDALLPKLTATCALTADTTASASLAVGTKPGGWSAFTGSAALAPFAAERTVAFETGLDTAFAQKTVTLAVRAFAYAIRDYQIERSFTPSDYLVVNAPRARSLGAELEAAWRPLPAWTIAATLGLTDVTLRDFTDPFTGTNSSGQRAPYTPAYDAHLSVTHRNATGWFATGEVALVGKIFYDESENPAFAQPARATFNARLGYASRRWSVSLGSENLGARNYYSLIIPGVGHAVPGAPRTASVECVVRW